MLNEYLDSLATLIKKHIGETLSQFAGHNGASPHFDDLCWYYSDPSTGRRTRILSCRHGFKGKKLLVPPEFALPSLYNHLLKVWIIEVCSLSISTSEKTRRVSEARKVLSFMKGDLYSFTSFDLFCLYKDKPIYASPFLKFCMKNGLMPTYDIPYLENHRDRTGHYEFEKKQSKLPDTQAVIAIGDVFNRVFENIDSNGAVMNGGKINIRDAFVTTSAALSLASFNRMAAEVPVLPKQRLQSYSETGNDPVYYLNWKGSKGYKDNKNHILKVIAGPIAKAMNYFYDACEPGRILCRFYQNPNQTLRTLIGKYPIDPKRHRHLSFDDIPNLFQLGYALGFYGIDDYVSVLRKDCDPGLVYHSRRAKCYEDKPIHALLITDKISTTNTSRKQTSYAGLKPLFGLSMQPNPFGDVLTETIANIQEWWISYFRSTLIPEFPLCHTNSENSIHLKDAMFCVLGSDFYRSSTHGSGGRRFQASHFSIVPLGSLASSLTQRLAGTSAQRTIFQDYGYPSKLRVKPHTLRHFGNTIADMSEIPIEIITALSGRLDPEQTHSYIHASHRDKVDRVSAVLNPSDRKAQSIRLVSAAEISKLTNLPASVTSTGICTQDLLVTPCDFLNDFVSQCFMCSETCHVAGDEASIDFLQKDLLFQTKRLSSVECDPRLINSLAMKQWYILHSRNIHILSSLINLMKLSPKGSIIRYSSVKDGFHLTDLPSKATSLVTCVIPDFETRLNHLLEQRIAYRAPTQNIQLQSLLSNFGISSKDS